MLIREKALQHWINNFYGYGSWDAKMWFVAYEEGGGDVPEEVAEKIDYFSAIHSVDCPGLCDIREMYRNISFRIDGPKADLFTTRYDYRFNKNAVLHGVWKNLIAFAHGYKNEEVPNLLEYQKNTFASSSLHKETLIQLYPLPSPHNHAWYYSWLDLPQMGFLKSRSLYEEHVYQDRITHILSTISAHRPEVVLMYAMNNINTLKRSVQEAFENVEFKMVKALKQQIPQYHRAKINGTILLITTQLPALRHNRVETGFDWEQFGRSIRQNS